MKYGLETTRAAADGGAKSVVPRSQASSIPFQEFAITQATNAGKARAAISPDGKHLVSVIDDSGAESR